MRIKVNGAYALEPAFNISAITQGDPAVVTAAGINFADGDWVYIQNVAGMTELNGGTYLINSVDLVAGTFAIFDLDSAPINSTGFPAYVSGGSVARLYTLTTPYAAVDLPYLKYAQSADVMSLTCVNLATGTEYAPQELSRFGATNWTISTLNPGARIAAPTGVTATPSNNPDSSTSPPTQPCAYAYQVTAVNLTTGAESVASGRVDVTNTVDMGVTAGSITVTWNSVVGAGQYNIYRTAPAYNTQPGNTSNALPVPAGAQFFFAGSAYGNQFVDTNIVTDANETPPIHANPFARGQVPSVTMTASSGDWTTATVAIGSGTGSAWVGEAVIVSGSIVAVIVDDAGQGYTNADTLVFTGDGTSAAGTLNVGPQAGTYPAVVSYFQQRRFYLQTLNLPDVYWASQDGLFTDFDSGNPPTATDAITASPFSQSVDGLQWAVAMPGGLVIFSGTSAWQLAGTGGSALNPQPLTPSSEQAQPQAFNGVSATLPPIRINYDIIFGDGVGSGVYSFNYNIYFNIYNAVEISWASSHLFAGHLQLAQWAWCRNPDRVIWSVRDDGVLLSLTWVKEQEVMGWTRHDTQGLIQGVCTVVEPPVNALYMIVSRFVQNRWLYFSERLSNHIWSTVEDCWCVDAGISTLTSAYLPGTTLTASAATGAGVMFVSSDSVWIPGFVGTILRMGGGIATVTAYVNGTTVIGTWTRPCVQTIPNDPNNTPVPAAPGAWSLLGQLTTVTGLGYLNGKSVVGLADGIPIGPFTVANGSVTLPFVASLVTIGLGYTQQIQSLYLAASQPTEQGRRKIIKAVTARVAASGWPYAAANEADGSAQDPPRIAPVWTGLQPLRPSPPGTAPPTYQTASGQTVTPLYTGDLRVNIGSTWRKPGQIAIQQTLPLPINLTAIVPEYLEGDAPETAISPRQQAPQRRGGQQAPA
jgi:hypothetical protein